MEKKQSWWEKLKALIKRLLNPPIVDPESPIVTPLPVTGDQIDPRTIVWDDLNVTDWATNVTMFDAAISGDMFSWKQTGATWTPVQKPGWTKEAIGNIWIVAKVNGVWRAATWDWIGPGVRQKQMPVWGDINDIHGSLEGWVPVKGEEVGFLLTTFARAYHDPTNEQRTQIIKMVWPY